MEEGHLHRLWPQTNTEKVGLAMQKEHGTDGRRLPLANRLLPAQTGTLLTIVAAASGLNPTSISSPSRSLRL